MNTSIKSENFTKTDVQKETLRGQNSMKGIRKFLFKIGCGCVILLLYYFCYSE